MDSDVTDTAISRRLFLKGSALTPLALALGGVAISAVYLRPAQAQEFYLRPPGALDEKRFLAACVKCGKCAQACLYQSVKIAGGEAGVGIGTPYIVPRVTPCYLCPDIPCAKVCPSGALDKKLNDVEKIRMGTAVIVDRAACLSLRGLRCEVCYRQCPLIDKAITLRNHQNLRTGEHVIMEPFIHKDKCVGCGICEKVCVLEKPVIVIQPTPPLQKDHYDF